MNSNGVQVTRVSNGWYTIGGCLTGVEIVRDTVGSFWEVRKDDAVVSLAQNFDTAKALAFEMVA